ncbi:hypothetical protein EDD21DRAFT_169697 [Dissophora ornata]|nr:hypothetical protein EDD21DRAFT_169697 [Dissophora ornata]
MVVRIFGVKDTSSNHQLDINVGRASGLLSVVYLHTIGSLRLSFFFFNRQHAGGNRLIYFTFAFKTPVPLSNISGMQTRRKKVRANVEGSEQAALTPAKRKKTTSEYKKVEISHAATLPRIVWVFDAQNKWWPGKIAQYPPEDNRATVVRFGAIEPKTITVDCSESIILPFGQKPENPSGLDVPHTEDLDAALEEANEAQVHDDDDLPSMDDILSQFSSSPAMSSPSVAKKGSTGNQKRLPKSDTEYSPDISLTIPGELVLAISDRFYYPGRVMTFNNKTNKYKVTYRLKIEPLCPINERSLNASSVLPFPLSK